jgi:hypothetical protein
MNPTILERLSVAARDRQLAAPTLAPSPAHGAQAVPAHPLLRAAGRGEGTARWSAGRTGGGPRGKNRENTPPGLPFMWRLPMAVYVVQFPTCQTTAIHPPDRPGSRPGREKSLFPIPSDNRPAPTSNKRMMPTPTTPSPGFMLSFRRCIS